MIGKTVLHYNILEKLGEGGMGEVYLAEDTTLKRKVALKFMNDEYASDPEFIARFEREARSAAALNHPNIVTIHEVGQYEDRPYISMSYVDGETLGEIIERGELSVDRALEIAAQISEGLGHAHASDLIHRDIKPDNVIIGTDGRANILDFGLARLRGASKQSGAHSTLGTIFYMSPEQARGGKIDHRSDIFSLGAVLYEMLTGRSPFKRDHSAAVLYSIANEDPTPPSELNKNVSAGLQRVVMRALAKNPDERYPTTEAFTTDLKRLQSGTGPLPVPHHHHLLRYLLPTSAVFLLVLAFFIFKPFQIEFSGSPELVAASNSLAIMYFENVADADDPGRLGEIATNLVITDLSESEYMEVVSSQRLYDILKLQGREDSKVLDRSTATQVARQAGAERMLLGSILQAEPIIMTSQLIDVETGNVVASQRVSGAPGEKIFELVDRLTAEIRKDLALPAEAGEGDAPVAEATTHSREAFRYYLEGVENLNKYYGNEAKAAFQKALEYDSTMAMAHYQLSSRLIPATKEEKRKSIAKALEYCDKMNEKDKQYIKSTNLLLSGDEAGAVAALDGVIAKYPKEKEAYKALGDIHRENGRTRESIGFYRKAIEIDPLDKLSYNILAYQYQDIGDVDNYIWAIYQYISLAPDEANPYDSRGDLYAFSGKIDRALDSYREALKRKPDFFPSQVKMGHMYLFQGAFASARRQYAQLLESDQAWLRADGRWFLALDLQYQGKFEAALAELERGIAADEEDNQPRGAVRKRATRAGIYIELGRFDEARAELDRALRTKITRDNPETHRAGLRFLTYYHARKRDFAEAEAALEEFRQSLDRDEGNPMRDYWYLKGWIELEKENPAEAAKHFEKAAKGLGSKVFRYTYALALAYLRDERLTEAVNEYQRLLRRYSEERAQSPIWAVTVHYHAGVALERSGRHNKAIEQYEEFLGIWNDADPGMPEVKDARARLVRLRQS
ncbi:MAG: protein kinase [Candidatus Krumholzibacteriia bacterium]